MGFSIVRYIFNLTKGNNMPLIVNYTKHQNWSAKSQKFDDPKMRTEADQIGHLLLTIGVSEISDKTINEVIIRKLILDRFYGSQDHTIKEYKEIFNKHIMTATSDAVISVNGLSLLSKNTLHKSAIWEWFLKAFP